MAALEMKRASPMIGVLVDRVLRWQLAHPEGSKEECLDDIKEFHTASLKDSELSHRVTPDG